MLTLTWHPGAVVFPWPAGTGTRGPRPHTRQKAPPYPPVHAPARGSESAAMEAFRVPGTVLTVRYRGTALVRPGRSLRARSPPVVTVPAARPWGTDQVRGRRRGLPPPRTPGANAARCTAPRPTQGKLVLGDAVERADRLSCSWF